MLALILLLAASRLELVDEVYQVPARDWRYVELGLKQRPALVAARFDAPGADRVRLTLLRREDLERLREGMPHGLIESSLAGPSGALDYFVQIPGDYVLLIENAGPDTAPVHLSVSLDFGRRGPAVTRLSPRRQMTVVAISFAAFFAIVSFSAHRLLRGIRRTPNP